MRAIRTLLLCGVMLASGAGLFAAAQRARTEAHPASPAEPVAPSCTDTAARPVVVMADPTSGALAERLAGIEARLDKLAAAAVQDTHAEAASRQALYQPPESRTADEQRGMDEATQIVDTAIARGTWLEADQTRMREVAVRLLPADRFALLAKLAVAGNADRLRDLTSRPMSF